MFAIWTRLNFPPQYDEIAHQSFAHEIANHPGWSTLIDYEGARDYEAQGPLFFALLAAYGHWFGFALPILRTLTIVFAVLLAVSFAKLAEQLGYGASAISLICLPYFVILSTTAMTDVPCLALTVFAVYAFLAYTDSKSLFHLVVGVLASTAASYIRIDSLYVLVAIGAAFAVQNCLTRQLAIGLIVPFLLRAPLVFIWGGLAAPTAHGRPNPVALGLDLSHVVFSLAVIGLYFWPFAFVLRGDWRRSWFGVAVAMLIAVVLCVFWMPKLSAENTDNYAGTIRTVLLRVSETGFRADDVVVTRCNRRRCLLSSSHVWSATQYQSARSQTDLFSRIDYAGITRPRNVRALLAGSICVFPSSVHYLSKKQRSMAMVRVG